jgi:hypothetical protein
LNAITVKDVADRRVGGLQGLSFGRNGDGFGNRTQFQSNMEVGSGRYRCLNSGFYRLFEAGRFDRDRVDSGPDVRKREASIRCGQGFPGDGVIVRSESDGRARDGGAARVRD